MTTATDKPTLSVYTRNECQGATAITDLENNIVAVWDDHGENYYYFKATFQWYALECPVTPDTPTAACIWGNQPVTKIEETLANLLLNN